MSWGRRQAVDAVAAVAVLLACGLAASETDPPAGWWPLLLAVAAPVAVRSRWPLPAALLSLAASVTVLAAGIIAPNAAPALCAAVALTQYSAARSVPALAAAVVAGGGLALLWPGAPLVAIAVAAIPWLTGRTVLLRRRAAADRAERALTQERLRMARDVHDTVAHTLSMIAVKAGVARHVAPTRPEESAAALAVIETASRDALVEMREALGLLRDGEDVTGDLAGVARHAEQAGVAVTLTIDETPAAVRSVVYRIVQESLTNVVRHAGATRCQVTVTRTPQAVTVRVVDDGSATPSPIGVGHGLRGMRERLSPYGGSLEAGPESAGGFAVSAIIPYAKKS